VKTKQLEAEKKSTLGEERAQYRKEHVPLQKKSKQPEGERPAPERSKAQIFQWRTTYLTWVLSLLTSGIGRSIEKVKGAGGTVQVQSVVQGSGIEIFFSFLGAVLFLSDFFLSLFLGW